jgi:hypothetical protein
MMSKLTKEITPAKPFPKLMAFIGKDYQEILLMSKSEEGTVVYHSKGLGIGDHHDSLNMNLLSDYHGQVILGEKDE